MRLGHLFTLALLFFATPEIGWLAAGTVLSLLGLAVRVAAAGCIHKDETLSRSGPYAFVRNPLYVGSFMMYLGFCVASGNVYIVAAFLPFFGVVYFATILREEAFLSEKFGEEFARFKREVPRFLPRVTPAAPLEKGWFGLQQAMKNREYEGMVAAVAVLCILWILGATAFFPFRAALGY